MRSVAAALIVSCSLTACDGGSRNKDAGAAPAPEEAVATLADRAFEVWLDLYVDDRIRAGVPTGAPDLTEAGVQRMERQARAVLQELDRIPAAGLSEDAQLTHGLIRESAEVAAGAAEFFDLHFALAPNQASFHFLAYVDELSKQPVATEADRSAYLALVGHYGELARQHLNRLQAQQARDSRMSQYLIERTVRMLESLRSSLHADLSVERAIAAAPTEQREAFRRTVSAAVSSNVEPAFDSLIAFLRGPYSRQAPTGIGLSQYPRGREYYRYLIRRNSSLQLAASDIHQLGRRRVAEIEAAIMASAPSFGYRGATLRGFFDFLKADPRFTASSVADWEREYAADLEAMRPLLSRAFAVLPKAPYRLQAMRESEQGLAYGYYSAPTPSQPEGVFYFSGSDPSGPSLLGTRALAYHEVVPGHHLQLARVVETRSLNKLRSIYWVGGYTEGWAEYGVALAEELGAYADPYEQLGHRIWELLMSARLVADTGINEFGWSRQEAERFWRASTNLTDAEIDSEIQRSVAIPGQLLVYRLGYEKMRELRQRTQQALGERFDLKKYHELLLEGGALPLPLLERKVDQYIRAGRE